MGKFISLFSGVGGIDLGMEQAGHECVAQVEWDKNAAGVLKHRWPNVPLFCDVSKVSADDLPDADFITYGFPCQDLSVAGKREGLSGKRSGLFYEATRLIRELRTRGCGLRFAVAENVGGLFSADDGVALARCIRELLDCGACETGWRLLDSQYFGVAQRRKRVFIVSDFGGESVDEILAITESLPGHPPPSRKAGKGTAGDAGAGFTASSFGGYEQGCGTLRSQGGDLGGGSETLAVNAAFSDGSQTSSSLTTRCHDQFMPDKGNFCAVIQAQSTGSDPDLMATLCAKDNDKIGSNQWVKEGKAIIEQKETYCLQGGGETSQSSQGSGVNKDVSVTLRSQQGGEGVGVAFHASQDPIHSEEHSPALGSNATIGYQQNLTVRRLTPIECERLQGFPDNWTSEKMELTLKGNEWKATGKVFKQADGPRYKQMGNAITVNVGAWIGKQIGKVLSK